jgi:hypothetical protein
MPYKDGYFTKRNGSVKLIGKNFFNKKTRCMEKHYFENVDTLKVFIASFCMPWGDYEYPSAAI